jgi:hypothetical protein
MEEAPENGEESSHSAHANSMNEWVSCGIGSCIYMYINTVANRIMLHVVLWYDFSNMIFKIKHKLCIYMYGPSPQGQPHLPHSDVYLQTLRIFLMSVSFLLYFVLEILTYLVSLLLVCWPSSFFMLPTYEPVTLLV